MTTASHECDILVVGGGLAGTALALSLARSEHAVSLIEPAPPRESEGWDARVYALSPASRRMLEVLGVWQRLDASRVSPVTRMEIHGDRGGQLNFSTHEVGSDALAWIVEGGRLQRELWETLDRRGTVGLLCPATLSHLSLENDGAWAELSDGTGISARLVVAADGADSAARDAARLQCRTHEYGELGVVANLACERAHRETACQWFRADGVLAFLPLPGDRISIVWSTPEQNARQLIDLPPEDFCERVREASGDRLGSLRPITPARGFKLRLMRPESAIATRMALIGDAAHAIHPLSGHGINLGFADARELAQVLRAIPAGSDPGHRSVLRRYERARAEEVLALQAVTHGLHQLFKQTAGPVEWLRNAGLNLFNHAPVVREILARYAMG